MAELQKREDEMRQMFVVRVKEKETELKEAEKEVERRAKENQDRLSRIFYSNNLENNSTEEPPAKVQGQIQCFV